VVGSSWPESMFPGHCNILSAPSSLRTFFHNDFESMAAGKPEMTMVRIASGSAEPALGSDRCGCRGFLGFEPGEPSSVSCGFQGFTRHDMTGDMHDSCTLLSAN
jgi:hypothetical protein